MPQPHTIARRAGEVASRLTRSLLELARAGTTQDLGSGGALSLLVDRRLAGHGLATLDPALPDDVRAALEAAHEVYVATVREEPPFADVLGGAYMALASRAKHAWLGQYFTPWEVACMLAAMHDVPARLARPVDPAAPLITVCDPTCGSGVLLLATLHHAWRAGGAAALRRLSVTGVDIDRLCARMAAAQFLAHAELHALPVGEVVVHHGDALRLEIFATIVHATAAPAA